MSRVTSVYRLQKSQSVISPTQCISTSSGTSFLFKSALSPKTTACSSKQPPELSNLTQMDSSMWELFPQQAGWPPIQTENSQFFTPADILIADHVDHLSLALIGGYVYLHDLPASYMCRLQSRIPTLVCWICEMSPTCAGYAQTRFQLADEAGAGAKNTPPYLWEETVVMFPHSHGPADAMRLQSINIIMRKQSMVREQVPWMFPPEFPCDVSQTHTGKKAGTKSRKRGNNKKTRVTADTQALSAAASSDQNHNITPHNIEDKIKETAARTIKKGVSSHKTTPGKNVSTTDTNGSIEDATSKRDLEIMQLGSASEIVNVTQSPNSGKKWFENFEEADSLQGPYKCKWNEKGAGTLTALSKVNDGGFQHELLDANGGQRNVEQPKTSDWTEFIPEHWRMAFERAANSVASSSSLLASSPHPDSDMADEDSTQHSQSSRSSTPNVSNPGTPRQELAQEVRSTPPLAVPSTSSSVQRTVPAQPPTLPMPPSAAVAAAATAAATAAAMATPPQQVHPMAPQSKYSSLLAVIEDMGRDIRPTYAGNRTSSERLKRSIVHARILVRECLMECERSART